MSPRGTRRRRERRLSATAARIPARRARRRRAQWALIAAVAVIAVLAPMLARWHRPRPMPDPLAGMSSLQAADSADHLEKAGRHFEAIRFIRHLAGLMTRPDANFEAQLATAEHNASIEARVLGGVAIPVTRSSVERVALMRDATERLDQAMQLARGPEQRRNVLAAQAGQLVIWGFVREAYDAYREADTAKPLDGRARGEAIWLEKMLGDPTASLPEPARP